MKLALRQRQGGLHGCGRAPDRSNRSGEAKLAFARELVGHRHVQTPETLMSSPTSVTGVSGRVAVGGASSAVTVVPPRRVI